MRVIFKLPAEFGPYLHPLAYVEYFTGRRIMSDTLGMWKVRRAQIHGRRKAGIIRVDTIRSSCQLFPDFGAICPPQWTSENVLDTCPSFYVSPYLSKHFFNVLSMPYNLSQPEPGVESSDDGMDKE